MTETKKLTGISPVDSYKNGHTKASQIKEVDVIIMEDDTFYNNLLAKVFENFQHRPEIKANYQIKIEQYSDPEKCLKKAQTLKNDGRPVMAFIDYYLGKGITGQQVIKMMVERNADIEIVLISQSEKVIGDNRMIKIHSPHQNKIIKHEHTPEICCMMLNQFVKSL